MKFGILVIGLGRTHVRAQRQKCYFGTPCWTGNPHSWMRYLMDIRLDTLWNLGKLPLALNKKHPDISRPRSPWDLDRPRYWIRDSLDIGLGTSWTLAWYVRHSVEHTSDAGLDTSCTGHNARHPSTGDNGTVAVAWTVKRVPGEC